MSEMPVTETGKAEKFIKDKLDGSTELATLTGGRNYKRKVKKQTAYPCNCFFLYTGRDEYAGGGGRLYSDLRFVVACVDQCPSNVADSVDQGAALIDAALTNQGDGDIFVIRRLEPYDHEYSINGIDYEERGGIYQLAVAK